MPLQAQIYTKSLVLMNNTGESATGMASVVVVRVMCHKILVNSMISQEQTMGYGSGNVFVDYQLTALSPSLNCSMADPDSAQTVWALCSQSTCAQEKLILPSYRSPSMVRNSEYIHLPLYTTMGKFFLASRRLRPPDTRLHSAG